MHRVLRIVLIITFMLLLILWFSTIFNTCNKKKAAELAKTEESELTADTMDVFEDLGEDLFEDGSTKEEDPFEYDSSSGDAGESVSLDKKASPGSESFTDYTGSPSDPVNQPAPSPKSSAGDNASYLVVAGSFLVQENAVKMKNKLVGMGYSAEVRNFNFSQYYSVIAGRFNSRTAADKMAGELKSRGVDCLVQKRKY